VSTIWGTSSAELYTVTVTPGSVAPVLSVIVPAILPVLTPCADVAVGAAAMTSPSATAMNPR
jgi:hypothetical protein